jgi:O-antigen/teichoic acid export membrane protein
MSDVRESGTSSWRRRRFAAIPEGTGSVAVGLAVLGGASYAFLVISARALGPEEYGALSVLWAMVFTLAVGVFLPWEQEITRTLAAGRVVGEGTGTVYRRTVGAGAVVALVLIGVCILAWPVYGDRLFRGEFMLLVGLAIAIVGYFAANVAKGTLAGTGDFGRYGLYLGGEGTIRLAICLLCVALGVQLAGPFGLALGIAPMLAVVPSFIGRSAVTHHGPPVGWRALTTALGGLLAGSLLAQVLINAPALLMQLLVEDERTAEVGVFTVALIAARVPLFLFQAVQATLLPKLSSLAASARFEEFRSVMQRLTIGVTILAVAAVVGAFTVGPTAVSAVFGPDYDVSARTLGMLALGSAAYILAIALAQAIIALGGARRVAVGWATGVVTLLVVTALGQDTPARIEWGYVVGTITAVVAMALMMRHLLARGARPHTGDVVEAMLDLPLEP